MTQEQKEREKAYRAAYSKKWHQLNKEKRAKHDAEYRLKAGIGVYGWKDINTGDYVYIGSGQLYIRKKGHLSTGNCSSKKLRALFTLNGKENYQFEIIEKCDEENRIKQEQHYIDQYKPICNIRKAK
jgi:hypothetical protein